MSNLIHKKLDGTDVVIQTIESIDAILASAGAATVKRGTILARNTSTGALGVYASNGSDGLNVPKYVLLNEVVFAGAGSEPVSVMSVGEVWKSRLIVHADGDDSNIGYAVLEALRPTIIARLSDELGAFDNGSAS